MKHLRMACVAGALAAMFGFGAAGCGSDDEEAPAQNTGPLDCAAANGVAECKRRAAATTCAAMGDCACDNCCTNLADCEENDGCIAIRDCALRVGCRGVPCYAPTTCQQVIDDNGGPNGVPANIA